MIRWCCLQGRPAFIKERWFTVSRRCPLEILCAKSSASVLKTPTTWCTEDKLQRSASRCALNQLVFPAWHVYLLINVGEILQNLSDLEYSSKVVMKMMAHVGKNIKANDKLKIEVFSHRAAIFTMRRDIMLSVHIALLLSCNVWQLSMMCDLTVWENTNVAQFFVRYGKIQHMSNEWGARLKDHTLFIGRVLYFHYRTLLNTVCMSYLDIENTWRNMPTLYSSCMFQHDRDCLYRYPDHQNTAAQSQCLYNCLIYK